MTPDTFKDRVDRLLVAGIVMDVEERVIAVNDLIEEYVQATGDVPPQRDVDRLTSFILEPDLRSNNKRHASTPVYSDDQLAKKARRTGITANIDDYESLTYQDVNTMKDFEDDKTPEWESEAERRVHRAIRMRPDAGNREIARALGVSPSTVAKYRKTS